MRTPVLRGCACGLYVRFMQVHAGSMFASAYRDSRAGSRIFKSPLQIGGLLKSKRGRFHNRVFSNTWPVVYFGVYVYIMILWIL